jgi:hypothetical protein
MTSGLQPEQLLRATLRPLCSALLLLAAGSSAAAVRCTDNWGREYVLPQQVSAALAGMHCVAIAPTAGADTRQPAAQGRPAGSPEPLGSLLILASRSGGSGGLALGRADKPGSPSFSLPSDPDLRTLIHRVAHHYGHDPQLLNAIIHVESRFNPEAVSPKGAIGLMQVMPATARRMGVDDPARALLDPGTNLRAGARYLRLLWDMFAGQPELAIAAYNAGEGAVLRHGKQVPPYPETRNYVDQVLRALEIQRAGMR